MDFDDVNDEKINQSEQSFYSDDVTLEQIDQSEPSFYSDDIIDVKLNQSESSIDANDVILDQSEPVEYEMEEPSRSEISAFSIDESPSDSFTTISDDSMNTSDNMTTISAISDDFGDETTKVVAYHDNGDIMQHDDGFSKVIKSTVVQESVTMTTKTEVREVTPEELQQLLAQQQQEQQTGSDHQQGAITTTVVQQQIVRTQISSESGNNVPIERKFEPTEEVVIKSSVTRETSENVNVLEIELNPDEESLTNEELVERMFGNEENVMEFFKQDDDQQLTLANTTNDVDNDDKDVSKIDDYGTQV
uniref:Uncharacterized protein n=2 Tax=Clytia hemisphaerica TaxID=252671 RepID=A0A7M5X491_9CNID